jgi:hypothetical protein
VPLLVGSFMGLLLIVIGFSIIEGLNFLFGALLDCRVVGLAMIGSMIGGYAWFLRQLIRENSPESQEKRARELVQCRLNNRDTLSLISSHSRCLGMSREFDRDQDGERTGPVV